MGLPVGLVGDGQVGQTGAVVIHDVAGAVCWTHDLQETRQQLSFIHLALTSFFIVVILSRISCFYWFLSRTTAAERDQNLDFTCMAIRMKSISVPMPQKPTVQNFRSPETEKVSQLVNQSVNQSVKQSVSNDHFRSALF